MTLTDSEIFNDTKHHAASMRQLSVLFVKVARNTMVAGIDGPPRGDLAIGMKTIFRKDAVTGLGCGYWLGIMLKLWLLSYG